MQKLILGVLLLTSFCAQAEQEKFRITLRENIVIGGVNHSVVEFEGPLVPGSAEAVVKNMKAAKAKNILFELNSSGGRLLEAKAIQDGIDALRADGSTVDTFVANGSKCASACTLLFLYGTKRIAAATAAFMFHAVQYESLPGVTDRFQTNMIVAYYIEKGIDPAWIKEQMKSGVFSEVNDVWISAKESVQIKMGLVTDLWSHIVYHQSAPFDPQIRSR